MKFTEIDDDAGALIEGYGPAGVRVRGRDWSGGLLVCAAGVVADWGPAAGADITAAHLTALLAEPLVNADGPPQVVLIGTGRRQRFPAPETWAGLLAAGIGVEIMDTGAACRTYNVLLAEGRRVVAALLAEPPA